MSATRDLRHAPTLFLLLSAFSGVVELGPVFIAAREYGLLAGLVAGLAYQLGNLAASSLPLAKTWTGAVLVVGVVLLLGGRATPWMALIGVACVSVGLQKYRRFLQKASAFGARTHSTLVKRVVRIAGFAFAGLVDLTGLTACAVVIAGSYLSTLRGFSCNAWRSDTRPRPLQWSPLAGVMVVHQMHYFSYAYILPFLFAVAFKFGGLAAGAAFALGWVTYASIEKLLRGRRYGLYFLLGHGLVVLSLSVLASWISTALIVVLAWAVSGLGGGTVFCLSKLNSLDTARRVEMDRWEDIGHLAGVAVPIVLTLVGISDPSALVLTSAALAALTALAMTAAFRTRIRSGGRNGGAAKA